MRLIDRFAFWRRSGLQPYELTVLNAVAARLPEPLRMVYDAQIRLVRVSRETLDKEVLLQGLPESVPLFPNRDTEMRLATVRIAGRQTVRADVWVSSGKVLALTFDEPPRKWAEKECSIVDVMLWEDLAAPAVLLEAVDTKELLAWANGLPVTDALGPLPVAARARRIEALASRPPDDWLKMLAISEGFHIGDAKVYGVRDARTVVLDDEEVVVIAESDGPKLLVLSRTRSDGRVYVYDLERHELSDAGSSFRDALSSYLSQ